MNRSPGKIQRAIREVLDKHPDSVHTIDNLPWSIYCGPDFDDFIAFQATKAHRVAIIRALEGMDLGDWQQFHEGNQRVLVNRASVLSMATFKCHRNAAMDGRHGMSCQMWPTYHRQVIPIIREVNEYLAKTDRPPWKVSDMPEKYQPRRFDHRFALDPRLGAALEAELAELMEGNADAVPADQRDPAEVDKFGEIHATTSAEAEQKNKVAKLAKAIAMVQAAGLMVIDPRFGGPCLADAVA